MKSIFLPLFIVDMLFLWAWQGYWLPRNIVAIIVKNIILFVVFSKNFHQKFGSIKKKLYLCTLFREKSIPLIINPDMQLVQL